MLFKNVTVLGEDFKFRKDNVAVENGCFCKISQSGVEMDCSGMLMLPGLVDIHTHGAAGYDNMDFGFEAIDMISRFIGENGVTTYLPTLITQSHENMRAAAENIANAQKRGVRGAKIGGIYMEGPYFSVKYKGAQNEEYIRDPDAEEFFDIDAACGNIIRIISIAPERNGAPEFLQTVSGKVKVAIGHTDSDYDTAVNAIRLGASHMTHTYNAMRGLHHRSPNAICAAIDSNVTCECICDGIHIHPAMIRLLYKAVGRERLVLISDSLRATGMPDGEYDLGGQRTILKNGRATLPDGTIAGSTATLLYCVKKAVEIGLPIEDAVRAASYNPSKAAGIADVAGVIAEGRDADFILTDSELNLKYVYINGNQYKRK
ncbi:MAG: N-acetylglucosamine-6-phosphate deacetylase [Firmicutes bacterium]|nr:N-acetylglucosamine-6-phosphate deacetylase [Bacillota bacterium]